MKKILLVLIAFVVFCSHDMYLKLDTYFLRPNTSAAIQLFNGTFEKSENVIARDRMIDVSLVGNGNRTRIDTAQWSDQNGMTILSFKTGEAGTWVAGVSTRPRNIEMTAADFNDYLEHDGVLDMLEWRNKNDALERDAVEQYAKHVKAIFQVGDEKTDDWQTALGYPIEFIPLSNPYDLHTGDQLEVQLLWQGEPLANQLVYVDSQATEHGHSHDEGHAAEAREEHSHDHDHAAEAVEEHSHDHDHAAEAVEEHSHDDGHTAEAGEEHSHDDGHTAEAGEEHSHNDDHATETAADHHHAATQLRTDADGKVTVHLTADGLWYLRTINLIHSEKAGLTHESNWATLSFEVVHSHDEETHTHDEGIPAYAYWIGSLVLLAGLFFWFNRKR